MAARKRARRIAVNWMVEIKTQSGEAVQCRIVNVSMTGILFMSARPFQPSELLGMTVAIRPVYRFQCVARVARELPGNSRVVAYAAEFVRFVGDGQQRLIETLLDAIKHAPSLVAREDVEKVVHSIPENTSPTLRPPLATVTFYPSTPGGIKRRREYLANSQANPGLPLPSPDALPPL